MSQQKLLKDELLFVSVRREITEPEELQAEDEKRATAEQSKNRFQIPVEVFQKLKENEADMKLRIEHLRNRVSELESVLSLNEAEKKQLLAEIHTLEENEEILTQQNKSLTADLAHFQSLAQKKHDEIRKLKEKINELDWWVDEAVYDKEAQVAFLTAKMEAEIKTLQKELHNLQEKEELLFDQNARVVAELTEVVSQRDKLKAEASELRKSVKDLKYQMGEAGYQIMKREDEIKKLYRIIADKQDQIDDLNKDREIKSQINQDLKEQLSLLQEEKILADSEEMMKLPLLEETPPNSGSGFPSGKCLLKVGLGVAMGGLLVSSAFWATSAFDSYNAWMSFSSWDWACNLLEPY